MELDGPSFETVQRWNVELTSIPVRERILQLSPSDWLPTREDRSHAKPEQAYTWKVARDLISDFKLKIAFASRILQLTRLSLMTRYCAA